MSRKSRSTASQVNTRISLAGVGEGIYRPLATNHQRLTRYCAWPRPTRRTASGSRAPRPDHPERGALARSNGHYLPGRTDGLGLYSRAPQSRCRRESCRLGVGEGRLANIAIVSDIRVRYESLRTPRNSWGSRLWSAACRCLTSIPIRSVAHSIGPSSASDYLRPGQAYARHIGPRLDPWLYRATGGRYPSSLGTVASAPLMATGAKSGQPREVQLTYFHDGPDVILLASNYGGPKHPQWYYNLKAHPECQYGDERFAAKEVTDSDEYARLYGLAEQVYVGYADYRAKAASIGREIPMFRLTPR